MGGLFFAYGERFLFDYLINICFSVGAATVISVLLLQYLVLGFFNPFRLPKAKAPPV